MNPGQESVDRYLRGNYPPCQAELDAYRADLREKVEALRAEDPHNQPVRDAYDAVLALLNGEQP